MNNDLHHFPPSIRTLENFTFPEGLDGRYGDNRIKVDHCLAEADNDLEAINIWLSTLESDSAGTYISYRNSAEKLLNWSCFSRKKAISSLNANDINDFIIFMGDPRPASVWISSGHENRNSCNWRPFRGPLSQSSIIFNVAAISLLFNWMRKNSYAEMPYISPSAFDYPMHSWNKFRLQPGLTKIITKESWMWIAEYIFSVLDIKIRLLIELLYFSNLRSSDIQNIRFDDCIAPSSECTAWRIKMNGMTNYKRCIYALPPIGTSLSQWFSTNNLLPKTKFDVTESIGHSPLLFASCMNHGTVVKKIFHHAAELAEAKKDSASANELRAASMICFRGALEKHAGSDGAFGLGLIAHSRDCRNDTADYFREIILTDEMINSSWSRLEDHWKPYNDRMTFSLRTGVLI